MLGPQSTKPLRRDDVVAAPGEVDDLVLADIIATGATVEELAEAQAWVADNEPPMNSGMPLAAVRVGRLVEILAQADEAEPDPADPPV
jgi:hypothetical protein